MSGHSEIQISRLELTLMQQIGHDKLNVYREETNVLELVEAFEVDQPSLVKVAPNTGPYGAYDEPVAVVTLTDLGKALLIERGTALAEALLAAPVRPRASPTTRTTRSASAPPAWSWRRPSSAFTSFQDTVSSGEATRWRTWSATVRRASSRSGRP